MQMATKQTSKKSKKERKYHHLSLDDRFKIERMLNLKKYNKAEIAEVIGCSRATIYNEIKRATYLHTVDYKDEIRYAPETADAKYRAHLKNKGRTPKLVLDEEQRMALEDLMVNKKYSPAAAIMELKKQGREFAYPVTSVNTIYSAIANGIFENLTLEQLPDRGKHKKPNRTVEVKTAKRASKGTSISKRDESVLERLEIGHWEMDTVKGKKTNKKCILVLTERLSRKELLEPLKAGTMEEVKKALNRIEKAYGSRFFKMFKTITVDNGSEFNDVDGMKKALYRVGDRFELYYCHPYSSWERGSNENQNRLVRRFYPKGSDFDEPGYITRSNIKECEDWINKMPRKMFGGLSSDEVFEAVMGFS